MLEHMIVARADIERQASSAASGEAQPVEKSEVSACYDGILPQLCDFVERAVAPEDLDEEEAKELGMLKAKIVVCLVELSSEPGNIASGQEAFWARMKGWLADGQREDLQSCALLCFGNRAREGMSQKGGNVLLVDRSLRPVQTLLLVISCLSCRVPSTRCSSRQPPSRYSMP